MLIPPVNFSLVVGRFYRSGHPIELNFPFLETLELKTIVYVGDIAPEKVKECYTKWVEKNNINLVHIPSPSVREPFITTDPESVSKVINLVLDRRNHPILLHSDKGKHRTGVVVGTIRKCLQQWSLAPIYEEYIRFALGKADADFLFIEQYKPSNLDVDEENYPAWVHGLKKEVSNS